MNADVQLKVIEKLAEMEERPQSALTSRSMSGSSARSGSRCELLNEDEEIQLKVPVQDCAVRVWDVFGGHTFGQLRCVGCSEPHSALDDR